MGRAILITSNSIYYSLLEGGLRIAPLNGEEQ